MISRADRSSRAVEAAAAAARELGLSVTEPTVLYDVFSVVVHLKPSPVVARVPVVLPDALLDLEVAGRRQQRELDVAQWLSELDKPVARPSPLVPREPVQRDGLSFTFWELVEQDTSTEPDYSQGTARAAELHAVLADYPAELPWFAPVTSVVPQGLEQLKNDTPMLTPDDVGRVRSEWDAVAPLLMTREGWEQAFPGSVVQPIHGDAPSYNIIATPDGVLWSDFEDVNLGPIEWDLAGFGPEHARIYNEAAAALGRPVLDERAQVAMDLARAFQLIVCLPLVPQLPELADGLKPFVENWRTMPFAGGLV
ncbi:aminoglycoside phosphotransferase [Kribbella flavida DSM 17836]|uniref:Aminoglycoside phosphotransferase n=1 Tax=Kribbella flavida (strain DSM 17836 / JCM 10339 / NBRC 14399) TaxID=479435 RepID=D2PQ73_KRIFD|nr:phosphotransferase [Kribbella flavida]ADB34775.1 aminoglycoside phosphotransferase [Kribbella flavida DSM 17836]